MDYAKATQDRMNVLPEHFHLIVDGAEVGLPFQNGERAALIVCAYCSKLGDKLEGEIDITQGDSLICTIRKKNPCSKQDFARITFSASRTEALPVEGNSVTAPACVAATPNSITITCESSHAVVAIH